MHAHPLLVETTASKMGIELTQPRNRELVGGDILAQCLHSLGVKTAFGIHGGHLDAFLVGCETVGINLVDVRHETVAVQAAEAYAKLRGTVGVAFVTSNSGFCNGSPGLATAFADRSPILCITASPPMRDVETNCLQGHHDHIVLAKPITKLAVRIANPEEIPRVVSYAIRMATSGIPGPVLLDFTIDALFCPPRALGAISWGSMTSNAASAPAPSPAALAQVAELWRAAVRPVIVIGGGAARTSDYLQGGAPGRSLLLELAEQTSTPVFYSTEYIPSLPHDHQLRGGPAGLLAILPLLSQPKPDLIILIGARSGWLLGGRSGAMLPMHQEETKLVHIDVDGSEIGRFLPVHTGVIADPSQFISAFLPLWAATSNELGNNIDKAWTQAISNLKGLSPARFASDPVLMPDGRMHPFHAISTFLESLASYQPIVIMDGAECTIWATDVLDNARPMHALASNGYMAYLGNGWGYTLGAGVACRDTDDLDDRLKNRLIINLQGDGSAGFHIAELDTFARHGLHNVLTVVMNNSAWGMSVAGQDIIYNSSAEAGSRLIRPISMLSTSCDFKVVAQGFGCASAKCTQIGQIRSAVGAVLKQMKEGKTSGLVELIISRNPVTDITKMLVGKPEEYDKGDSDVILVPYYENLPRPFYKGASQRK